MSTTAKAGQIELTPRGEISIKDYSGLPKAQYSLVSDIFRNLASEEFQCSMFCGRKQCKYDNPKRFPIKEGNVINGLYSSWVTGDILAMSRPSSDVIHKFDVIKQFHRCKIKSVVNLQRPGEHSHCGPGLTESGFTYRPQEDFMDNGIFFFNFGWRDYGIASMDTLLDMVQVMEFALLDGKIAVHCHAGLGRTGVIISCFLVYRYRISADESINYMREKRTGAIQTRGQMQCVKQFEEYLRPLTVIYWQPNMQRSWTFTLLQFLNKQRKLLHGYERRQLRYLPKIIHVVCQRLLVLADCRPDRVSVSPSSSIDVTISYSSLRREFSQAFVNENYNRLARAREAKLTGSLESVSAGGNPGNRRLLGRRITSTNSRSVENLALDVRPTEEVSYASVDTNAAGPITVPNDNFPSRIQLPAVVPTADLVTPVVADRLSVEPHPSSTVTGPSGSNKHIMFPPVVPGGLSPRLSRHTAGGPLAGLSSASSSVSSLSSSARGPISLSLSTLRQIIPEVSKSIEAGERHNSSTLAEILSCDIRKMTECETLEKAIHIEDQLNRNTTSAWTAIGNDTDVLLLSTLLWSWLEHLKQPVISAQDMYDIKGSGLSSLNQTTTKVLNYILTFISHIYPITTDLQRQLINRLVSSLTHYQGNMDNMVESTKGRLIKDFADVLQAEVETLQCHYRDRDIDSIVEEVEES